MNRSDENDEPLSYIIRTKERAKRELTAEYVRLADVISEATANQWLDEIYDAIASLAQFPRRCPISPEQFTRETRQLRYQRRGSQISHRVLFTITNEEPDALEPPTVTIVHLRHASARPMTRREIREIEGSE